MASHLSCLAVFLLLLLGVASASASGSGGNGTAVDAGRRARAEATVADLLSVHNEARKAVGVAPLVWSAGIAEYAKAYARSRRGDCAPRRSPLFYFGENIAVGSGGRHRSAAAVAAQWVDEGRGYDHSSNSCAAPEGMAGCARYTQVVWRNTTQLGCGIIVCDSGDSLLVCDYFPPGNYGDDRPY